jgi:hypothetical protein
MHDKPNDSATERHGQFAHPLRGLTALEFARLGGSDVVYVHAVTAGDLTAMLPDVEIPAVDSDLQLVMSADGQPLLIADTRESVGEWLSTNPVQVATLH